jgi:hypothetical protein
MIGETNPHLTDEEMEKLKSTLLSFPCRSPSPTLVRHAITLSGLPRRHLRHATTLSSTLSGCVTRVPQLSGDSVIRVLRAFRAIELEWSRLTRIKSKKLRTNFMNYRFVITEVCRILDINMGMIVRPMKSGKLIKKQEEMFKIVTKDVCFSNF